LSSDPEREGLVDSARQVAMHCLIFSDFEW